MKKNDIFTFTAPNGVEVTAVVVDCLNTEYEELFDSKHWKKKYLCYAQNRLFYYIEETQIVKVINDDFLQSCEDVDWYYVIQYHSHDVKTTSSSQEILVDYCILPDYDDLLERYSDHQITLAEEQSGM